MFAQDKTTMQYAFKQNLQLCISDISLFWHYITYDVCEMQLLPSTPHCWGVQNYIQYRPIVVNARACEYIFVYRG